MPFANIFKSRPPCVAKSGDDEIRESLLHMESQHASLHYAQPSRSRVLVSHAATFLVAVLFSTAVLSMYRRPSTSRSTSEPVTMHLNCGNSTTEARARGCVFDVLTNMWVPEPCWDRKGTEEFMRIAPWQGYDMQDAERLLTLEEMSERIGSDPVTPDPMSPPYWTPLREHVIHCALMWQRQHRGFMSGKSKMLDFHSLSYQHTIHCSNSLIHMAGAGSEIPDPLDTIGIRTWVGFSECDIELG